MEFLQKHFEKVSCQFRLLTSYYGSLEFVEWIVFGASGVETVKSWIVFVACTAMLKQQRKTCYRTLYQNK